MSIMIVVSIEFQILGPISNFELYKNIGKSSILFQCWAGNFWLVSNLQTILPRTSA